MKAKKLLEDAAKAVGGMDVLQEKLGVSRQAIWLWKTEKREPNGETTRKMIEFVRREEKRKAKSLESEFQ